MYLICWAFDFPECFSFLGGGATSICGFLGLPGNITSPQKLDISPETSVAYIIDFESKTRNHQTYASANLLPCCCWASPQLILLLKWRRLSKHEIKQAVNYMGPELFLKNAPPPPASNFVHFYLRSKSRSTCACLSVSPRFWVPGQICIHQTSACLFVSSSCRGLESPVHFISYCYCDGRRLD